MIKRYEILNNKDCNELILKYTGITDVNTLIVLGKEIEDELIEGQSRMFPYIVEYDGIELRVL